jgi:DNA-binding response OmpR family regulator
MLTTYIARAPGRARYEVVDVHISRLRRKLPSLRAHLTAIRGIGYRLDVDASGPLHATGS